MVASDTVVGLVGAGILLVALVGVFVYESQLGKGDDVQLTNATYSVGTEGSTYQFTAGTGTPVGNTGRCVPAAGQTDCTPARAQIDFKFQNLPLAGNLHYVVFLEGPAGSVYASDAKPSGNQFVTGAKPVNGNHGNTPKVNVCLETSGTATTCTWKIATFTVVGNALNGPQPASFITAGNHTLSLTSSGGNTNIRATLNDVQNKTGYAYRGWMVQENDTGLSYHFVGNLTVTGQSAQTINGTITGSAPGARTDYTRFIVTVEPANASIGIRPAGPAVITADYNVRALPSLQK